MTVRGMTNDTSAPTPEDPWVDVTPTRPDTPAAPHPGPHGTAPYYAPVAAAAAPGQPRARGRRVGKVGKVVGLFAAGMVAGALVVAAWTGFGTQSSPSALVNQNGSVGDAPQGLGGVPPQGQQGQQGFGPGGEQRVQGTLTAVSGSTITVRSSSGTATYTLSDQTRLIAVSRSSSDDGGSGGDGTT